MTMTTFDFAELRIDDAWWVGGEAPFGSTFAAEMAVVIEATNLEDGSVSVVLNVADFSDTYMVFCQSQNCE